MTSVAYSMLYVTQCTLCTKTCTSKPNTVW